MPSPSSIAFSLSLLTAGHLARRSLTPPNLPANVKSNAPADRVRLIAGPVTTVVTHLNSACIVYHALIALFYTQGSNNASGMTTASDEAYLEAICPHPTNLSPHLFAWTTTTTTLCLLSLVLGASLRLAAFKFLGRNFTFQLSQPDTLVTGGIYRFVQHPSYTGLWLLVAGYLGLIMRRDGAVACTMEASILARLSGWGGWVVGGLVSVLIPFTVMRVRDEEAMLRAQFGQTWERWHARTARFIPYLI